MKHDSVHLSRRRFLAKGFGGAGLVALTAGTFARGRAAEKAANPFAYDLERLATTDPNLIRYEQTSAFKCSVAEPRRVAIGPDGRVFIAGRNAVAIHGANGALLQELALTMPGRCVAVAADGSIFAGSKNRIDLFNAQGEPIGSWEVAGKKTWLTGLAVGQSDLFAADSGNRVVHRLDRSGKVLGRLGEKNQNTRGLIVPSPYLDVELAADGLVRINNPGRHQVEIYTREGQLELSWGKPSAAIQGFCGCCNPIALACFPDGRCVTCEKGLPRVKVYAADGTFECVVAGPESFPENAKTGSLHDLSDGSMGGLDAAIDSRGHAYVLDLVTRHVRILKAKT